jgi:hypothetical protein
MATPQRNQIPLKIAIVGRYSSYIAQEFGSTARFNQVDNTFDMRYPSSDDKRDICIHFKSISEMVETLDATAPRLDYIIRIIDETGYSEDRGDGLITFSPGTKNVNGVSIIDITLVNNCSVTHLAFTALRALRTKLGLIVPGENIPVELCKCVSVARGVPRHRGGQSRATESEEQD